MSVEKKIAVALGKDTARREAEFTYMMPENLTEAVSMLGEEKVYSEFMVGYMNKVQAPARKTLGAITVPGTKEENSLVVQDAMRTWVYGQRVTRRKNATDPIEAFTSLWDTLSQEKKSEMAAKFGMVLPEAPRAHRR